MGLILALNGLSYVAAALLSFYIYYSFSKKNEAVGKIGEVISVNGIFYLLMGLLDFLWFFDTLSPNSKDFFLIYTSITVISAMLLWYIVYRITDNKHMVYLMLVFISTLFAANFSLRAFLIVTLVSSYLMMILVFADLVYFSNSYLKKAGYLGLAYVIISSALSLAGLFLDSYNMMWFIPMSFMILILFHFNFDILNLKLVKVEESREKKNWVLNYAAILAKSLAYILSISLFIMLSTVSIHELGHALAAQYYDCSTYEAVIYGIGNPHTEIACSGYYNDVIVTLAGFAATLVTGLIFMLTGGAEFTKGISYMIFGFGILIAYQDFADAGMSANIITALSLLSLFMMAISIIKISSYHLEQQNSFKQNPNYAFEMGAKKTKDLFGQKKIG